MRSYFLTSVCAFLFPLLAGAAAAEDARAILDRAIEAHGGAARLERTKRGHLKGKTETYKENLTSKYEMEEWLDLPDRYKLWSVSSSSDTPYHREYAVNGKEGWKREGKGSVREFTVRQPLSVFQHWQAILAQLLLLREKDVLLTLLPEETRDGRTLAGIHATSPQGYGDFFFDKSTGLLARSKVIRANILGGEDAITEIVYDDYRDIQGVRYPMRFKVFTGKTNSSTIALSSVEFLDKIDDSVFTKPQTPAAKKPVEDTGTRKRSSQSTAESGERTAGQRNSVLIVATVGAGIVVGAAWLIVRASKRGKREMPPS
jgi:hypothetical protein